MPIERRLMRLRALVDRIERLPPSERREWMLQEARARIVDVETGAEPRPMRTLAESSAEPPPDPTASRASNGRAVKRPGSNLPPVAASRGRPRPDTSNGGASPSVPVPGPTPSHIAGPDPGAALLGADELLWLDDPPGDTVAEPGDGSTAIAPWRRGLRG